MVHKLTLSFLFLMAFLQIDAQIFGAAEVQLKKNYKLSDSLEWKSEKPNFGAWLSAKKDALWTSNTIDVCWENPTNGNRQGREWVRDAVDKTWGGEGNLAFSGWGECTNSSYGIRILVNDAQPHTKGLGKQLRGVRNGMVLNFTFNNWCPQCVSSNGYENAIKFVAVHEFGHALGFGHEQNRNDCRCNEQCQGESGDYNVTPCDPNSVMNYCNPHWNNYGQLSSYDKQGVAFLYGKKTAPNKPNKPREEQNNRFLVYFTDELGGDQVAENISFVLGGASTQFNISEDKAYQTNKFRVGKAGTYQWSASATSRFSNGRTRRYRGSGSISLSPNVRYHFAINNNNELTLVRD